jgi:F0F1-type ATP synthase assembly protein I
MSDIFDWDDDIDEKKTEAEVWGAYPLAQPPGVSAPPPAEAPAQLPAAPQDEVDTVLQKRSEPWQEYPPFSAGPQPPDSGHSGDIHTTSPGGWGEYPPDRFEDAPSQPGVWSEYRNESPEETARKGGLAMSAGIVFFSSVAFMLFLGWIFDWLFGSSPWGLIGGIVIGSIAGFIQFFRISSRIFSPQKTAAAEHPLMPPDEVPR